MATAPRSCAAVEPKAPLNEPTGVRLALAMTISEAGMSVSLWSKNGPGRGDGFVSTRSIPDGATILYRRCGAGGLARAEHAPDRAAAARNSVRLPLGSGVHMQHAAAEGAKPPSFLSHLFSDRRIAPMLVLGFASGIPFQLVYITQSAWLYEAKVPIATIGLMSELTLAYKFKFVWAPFLDRYDAPVFSRLLGRRRGWIVVSQLGGDGGAGRGRLRRSRALASLDGGVFRSRSASREPLRTSSSMAGASASPRPNARR